MKRFLALLAFAWLMAAPAYGLEPERREVIVINGRVWDGFSYKEMLLPSTLSTLHLLSGKDSAVSFVRTEEYYWPLSRQVYVDFEKQRSELDGVLRVERDGELVGEIRQSSYSIVYPQGAVNGDGTLLWGEEAASAYAAYQQGEKDFSRRYVEAQAKQTAYERRLIESGAARARGGPVEIISPPEPLPQPSLRLVTKPAAGYRMELEAGAYDISLHVDGKPVAGSARQLDVIEAKGRDATVADVVPEERWTRPLTANSEAARIFARPGSVFYVTLQDADRFDEAEYLPVVTPQAEPVAGRSTWVRRKPSTLDSLDISWRGQGDTLPVGLERLKVEQTEGSGFGYRVRGAKLGEKEDLTAFMIAVPGEGEVYRGAIRNDAATGNPFRREIIVVQPRIAGLSLGLALLPVAGWLVPALFCRLRTAREID